MGIVKCGCITSLLLTGVIAGWAENVRVSPDERACLHVGDRSSVRVEQRRDWAGMPSLGLPAARLYSKERIAKMDIYQCTKCFDIIESTTQPRSGTCQAGNSHTWYKLGEVGDVITQCRKCFEIINADGWQSA